MSATGARRLALIAFALGSAYSPRSAAAQAPVSHIEPVVTISGTVFDSIARAPLALPVAVVDMFRSMPGIMIARDSEYKEILVQRSMTNFYNPFCRIAVYVNGISLTDPNVDMLNSYLRPSELLGIELYHGGSAPPEFAKRNGCGSLVIWLR